MNIGKPLSVLTIVVYTVLAHIGGAYLEVHWIHVFNSLILVNILYHLLEWKYAWVGVGEEEEENGDETTNN